MRGLIVLSLIALATGCRTTETCRPDQGDAACCPGGSREVQCPTPASECSTASNQSAAANIEFRPGETVHVKAPAQKIVIESPVASQQLPQLQSAPPSYAPALQPAFTQPVAMAQATPAPAAAMVPTPMFMQPATPQMVMASSTQTTSPPHARLALGFDSFNLKIPYPTFYSVPGPQEVTTKTQYVTQQQTQMATVAMSAPQYALAQPTIAQAQFAVPGQTLLAQPQMMAPAQTMVTQPQMQVALPPQQMMMQPQAALPPCPQQQAALPPCPQPPASQAAPRDSNTSANTQPTQQQLDDLTKQVQSLERALSTPTPPTPQWHR